MCLILEHTYERSLGVCREFFSLQTVTFLDLSQTVTFLDGDDSVCLTSAISWFLAHKICSVNICRVNDRADEKNKDKGFSPKSTLCEVLVMKAATCRGKSETARFRTQALGKIQSISKQDDLRINCLPLALGRTNQHHFVLSN